MNAMEEPKTFRFALSFRNTGAADRVAGIISNTVGEKHFLTLNDFDAYIRNDIEMTFDRKDTTMTWSIPKCYEIIRYLSAIIALMKSDPRTWMLLHLSIDDAHAKVMSNGHGTARVVFRDHDDNVPLDIVNPTNMAKAILEGM